MEQDTASQSHLSRLQGVCLIVKAYVSVCVCVSVYRVRPVEVMLSSCWAVALNTAAAPKAPDVSSWQHHCC